VTGYARAVVGGEIVAGPHVRAACARHLRDLESGAERGLVWDADEADRFFRYCRKHLRLSEGQFDGRPFELEPSQKFICGSLFGWKVEATGHRRFRRAYIEQGKGNGKSPMVGAIGLYGMTADGESGAQIYSAGATKEQAGILFRDAVGMVNKSPSLARALTASGGPGREYNLAHLRSGSFFRPVSRETKKTGSGPRPHFALCDEVHEHPDSGVIDILERGFKFREQPLLVMITNSGSDRNSVCWHERQHAVAVAHGDREDDTTFSYVCALDEGDDPFEDESCWEKANPLLGVTITRDYLALQVKQAKDIPSRANSILRLHFCVWTDAEAAWISRDAWEACEDPEMQIEDFAGARCWVGLDLSATTDLTGKAYLFDDGVTDDGRPMFALFARGFTPDETLSARAMKDQADYPTWVDRGWLIGTPGKKVRLDFVAHSLVEDAQEYDLQTVAYDRYLYRNLDDELDKIGVELPTSEHPQGFNRRRDTDLWMPGSVDTFETLILEGRLRIEVNFALRSAVAGATFDRSPADLRKFSKLRATQRIDLAVASVMAVGAATVAGPREDHSIYEARGVLTV
jgi:phage terminase large subunit-like protein